MIYQELEEIIEKRIRHFGDVYMSSGGLSRHGPGRQVYEPEIAELVMAGAGVIKTDHDMPIRENTKINPYTA